jgi:hypothetical protein
MMQRPWQQQIQQQQQQEGMVMVVMQRRTSMAKGHLQSGDCLIGHLSSRSSISRVK